MQVLVINCLGFTQYALGKRETHGICSNITRETLSQFQGEWDNAGRLYGQFEHPPASGMTQNQRVSSVFPVLQPSKLEIITPSTTVKLLEIGISHLFVVVTISGS